MGKINDTSTYPNTNPNRSDHIPGTDVSNTGNDANGETVTFLLSAILGLIQSGDLPAATTSAKGAVEKSTSGENGAGTASDKFPDVAGVKSMIDTHAPTPVDPGLEFIASADASNDAQIDFTGFDASKYDAYLFVLQNIVPSSDNQQLRIRTSTDGGSSYNAGGSDYGYWLFSGGSSSGSASYVPYNWDGAGSASGEDGISGTLYLFGPHRAEDTIMTINNFFTRTSSSSFQANYGGGARNSSADVDGLRFYFGSGNIESGTITIYGLRNS